MCVYEVRQSRFTYDGEIDFAVSGGRVPEVDATSVDAFVIQLDFVDDQRCRVCCSPEKCSRPEDRGRGPQLGLAKLPAANVEAVNKRLISVPVPIYTSSAHVYRKQILKMLSGI